MSDPAKGRHLIIKAKGGFGNRILSAVTGIILADVTGRIPVIDWRDGDYLPRGVNAYPLLFDPPNHEDAGQFDAQWDVVPDIWAARLDKHPVDLIRKFYPKHHSDPFIYRRLSIDLARPPSEPQIAVFWSYLPKLERMRRHIRSNPQYLSKSTNEIARSTLALHFQPNERVRSEVASLLTGLERPIVGVHIRHTDRKVSLDGVLAELKRLQRRETPGTLFLATDNEEVQDRFRREYPHVVVIDKALGCDNRSLHDNAQLSDPLREAENALIDMWALAACDWLIHSRQSTFSVAAALIGGIPKSRQLDVDRWNARVVMKRWVQAWA